MSASKGLICVIVPVYKVEKYIAECIESILAQTYTNFRLILVDDGTPDNAGKICDEYAKKDQRITVIHQENAGVTRARARGVEEADNCEFITFIDGDDTIDYNYLKILYDSTIDETDIVINECGIHSVLIDKEQYLEHLFIGSCDMNLAPWNKLFRKSLFNSHTFSLPRDIIVGEDMLMNIRLAFTTQKQIRVINKNGIYHYRQNETSVVHTFKSTPEYEVSFQENLVKSIPVEELGKYFRFTIDNRLINFERFWGRSLCVEGMKQTTFYQKLKKDIEIYKYKMPIIERILFSCENPIVRFWAIKTKNTLKTFRHNLHTPKIM